MSRPRRAVLAVTTGALAALMLMAGGAAWAADPFPTSIAVTAPEAPVDWGSNWLLTATVALDPAWGPIVPPDTGTVDVYLDGAAAPYAIGLPVQSDGTVYIAPVTGAETLAVGDHSVVARFTPSAGQFLAPSQSDPVTLAIAALPLTVTATAESDPASGDETPTITAELGGAWVESRGTPAGSWAVAILDDTGTTVFESTEPREAGSSDPLVVRVDSGVRPGQAYSATVTFEPDAAVAAGIAITEPSALSFRTADGTIFDRLVSPIELSPWLLIALVVVVLALIAALIVVAIRLRAGSAPPTAEAAAAG